MKNIILPRLGETMEEGTIRKWLIAENDNLGHANIGQIMLDLSLEMALFAKIGSLMFGTEPIFFNM